MFGLASYSFEHLVKEPAVCYQRTGIHKCHIPLACFRLNIVLSKGLETSFGDCIGYLCSSRAIYALTGTYRAVVLSCRNKLSRRHRQISHGTTFWSILFIDHIFSHFLPLLIQMTCDFVGPPRRGC